MATALQTLVDRGLFLSVEHQRAFEEYLVPDAARVDFAGPRISLPGVDAPATPYLLGSSSPRRGTWIWSWQEPEHFLPAVLAAAESTRRYGVEHDIPELADDETPLVVGLDERLVIAAKAVTGVHAHYTAGAGAGARVWMLVRSDALTLQPPTVLAVGRTIAEGLHTGLAADHRVAVEGYARRRGLHLSVDADGRVVLSADDGGVELTFDGSTISGIDVVESRRPAGYAPEPVPVTLIEPRPVGEVPVGDIPVGETPDGAVPVRERAAGEEADRGPSQPYPTRTERAPVGWVPERAVRDEARPPAAPVRQEEPVEPVREPAPRPTEPTPENEPETPRDEQLEPAPEAAPQPAEEESAEEAEPRRRGLFGRLFGR
ncbi:hypothetical protein BKD30_00820 [Tersicoccus phoenicis]|uniref:Uncharacterized protein n=1 Tax=Tersicoccus phoenicis TaxID=554083 RepID=A0A1R1LP40_9MICC|nr:DUF6882 domain-containing protein [Tersicoccus phoenicis]OMH29272.1 hypothetical protein BKD30_00820 [Tersicoccus phoenicis]